MSAPSSGQTPAHQTRFRLRYLAQFVVGVLVATTLVVVPAAQSEAQANPKWECDGTPILMRGGRFHYIVPDPAVPGNLTIQPIPGTSGIWNSTAYDPTTDYVYGVGSVGGEKTVRAYDANGGIVFDTQIQDPYPDDAGTYAGTVLGDGRYIIHSVGNGNGSRGWYAGQRFNLWAIDPATGAATHVGSTPVNFADFSYNPLDGYLYQVVNRVLYKVDPNTGATTSTAMPGTFPNGSFGASWFDAAGFLYLFRNSPGDIFKVDPADTSTWVEVGEVGADGGTDGGSCVSQIDIKKDVVDATGAPVLPQDRVYAAGDTVTYKFTLINNGLPTQNLRADLCDLLPADGRTYTGAWTSTDGTAVMTSGGAAGDTSFCLDVNMPSSLWTDPANPGSTPTEVTIDVVLGDDVLPGTLENQATLDYDQDGTVDVLSDDPGDGSDPRDPTTIEVRGAFEVTKTVEGHPADNNADTFAITVSCTTATGASHTVAAASITDDTTGTAWTGAGTNTFAISNGDRVRVGDIPGGSTCTATETTSTAYATSTTSTDGTALADAGTVIIDQASDDEVIAFTNRTGSFRLIKRTDVSGSPLPIDEDGTFSFDIDCDNGLTQTISFVTTNGNRTRVFPNTPLIAHGAECTITENVPAGWTLTSANDQFVGIESGAEPTVTFDNERQFAPLTVTKSIVGLPAGDDPTAYSFDVNVVCTGGFEPDPYNVPGPIAIATDAPIVIDDLPVGTSCTVTEVPAPGFNTRYAPDQTVAVADDGTSTVAITNSTGSLIIDKRTIAATTHPIDPVADVDFRLDCTYPDTSTTSQTFTVTADALTPTGASGGVSHTDIGVLPPGTTCTATETGAPAGWSLTSDGSVALTITEANPEPTATFENTRDTGTLTITKVLDGVPAALDLDAEDFVVDVSCSGGFTVDPYVMNGLTVSVDTPRVIADLPTGADCTVTERADPRFSSTVAPATVSIDTDGESVVLTNTTSTFSLTKNTTSSTIVDDIDGSFDFAITCTNGGSVIVDETVTIATTSGTGSASAADLPLVPPGSVCTVDETVPAGWTLTDRTGGSTSGATGIEVTTVATGSTLAFENTLDTASLTITKDVTGAPVTAALEATTFVVNVTCTGNVPGGTWTSGAQNLVEGTAVVLAGLPVGAVCTVAETADQRFVTTYAPADTVTIAAAGSTVAVENQTSSLAITKTTSVPAGVDPDATFTFAVSCDTDGTIVHTETVTLTTSGGTATWGPPAAPFVAPGTVCTITETPPAAWAPVGSATQTVTTLGASNATANFTNERAVADLTITKTLLGPDGSDFTTESFTVDVSCTGDFASSPLVVNDLAITSLAPAVVPDLPTGAVCTITEDFDSRFQTLYSPDIGDGTAAQVTIAAGGTEAGITNVTGSLAIRKDTIAPFDHPIDLLLDIDYTIDCGAAFGGTRTVSVDALSGGQGIGGLTYSELPPMPSGTLCTITETVPTGWTVNTNPQQITISPSVPVAAFENTRNVGTLTVAKVLDGVPAGVDLSTEAFIVDVSCSGGFTVDPYVIADQTITATTPLLIENLPTGAVCSVTEDADARFATSITAPVTIDADGETVTVTNTTSTVSITKNTTGATTHPVELDGTFTFDVDCGADYTGTVILTTSGQTASWALTDSPLLPPGTVCTVTEQGPPAGWSLTTDATISLTTDPDTVQTATFANTRLTDTLTITKNIIGAPIDLSTETFDVTISCTGGFTAEPHTLGPFPLSEVSSVSIADLPVGAACEVTEAGDPRFTPAYDPDDQVAIIAAGGSEVAIDNRTASLTVTKEVVAADDQPLDVSGTFLVDVDCTDGTELTLTMNVVAGVAAVQQYPTIPLLPDGTACTITEQGPPAGWTLLSDNGIEVVLSSENPGDITLVNQRDTADLDITKTVIGAPADLDLTTTTFTVDVSCTGDFTSSPLTFNDQPIKHGETITIPNLPTGSVCTVAEDPDSRFAVTSTPADAATTGVTIDDDGETVAIVNATGEIMIVKNTEVSSAHPIDVTGDFTFAVDCGTAHIGTHTVQATTVTSATTATGFLRYDDLPAIADGTSCSITEQGPPAGWTLSSTNPVSLTVDSNGVQTASFTNVRDVGVVTVEKVLVGVPSGVDLDGELFGVTVSCSGDFVGGSHSVSGSVSVDVPFVVSDVPTGAVCSVSETPDARFATSVSSPVTVDGDGETLTVTNTTSTLTVSKVTSGPGTHPLDLDATFGFDVDCGALFDETVGITTATQTGNWTSPATPLVPPGTACTISENAATGWTQTAPDPQTITTDAALVANASFTNVRDVGVVTVEKVLVGVPSGVDLDGELFGVTVSCSGDFVGGSHSVSGSVSVDVPFVVSDVPTGAVCSVSETPDARFATSVSSPVTVDGDGETLTVTNTTSTLTVSKVTSGPGTHPLDLDATFGFDVDCGALFDEIVAITTSSQSGEWATPATPLVPPGTSCTISELTPPPGWTSTTAPITVVTDAAEIVSAEFENTRDVATLTVTKVLDGVPVGLDLDAVLFDIEIVCTGDFDGGTHTLATQVSVDAPVTIDDLPTNAVCTITEADDPRFAVDYAPANADETAAEVTVLDTGAAATITNTTGAIIIAKETVVDSAHPIDPTGTFSFDIDCGAAYTGVHELTTTFTTATGAMAFLTYTELPLIAEGTTCTITELDETPDWTLVTDRSVDLVVTSVDPQTASFTNDRVLGSLVVDKIVEGPADLDLDIEPFEITITCVGGFTVDPYTITTTITGDSDVVIENLPRGAVCDVTETPDPRFATTYPDVDAEIGSDDAPALDPDAEPADLSILNATGSFVIDKETFVDSTRPFDPDDTFTFEITCVHPDGSEYVETITISTTDGEGTWASPLLPAGHECTIVLLPPDGWVGVGVTTVDFVVGTDIEVFAFASERTVVDLTITKTLASIPSGLDFANRSFDISVTCEGGFGSETYVIPGDHAVSQDVSVTISDLPAASECVIAEAPDDDGWFTASYAPSDTITLSADGDNDVTVTNTGTEDLAEWARRPVGPLAFSGSSAQHLAWFGFILLAAGVALLAARRRMGSSLT